MILAAASTPWLLLHEMRLARRGLFAARGMRWRAPVAGAACLIVGGVVGLPAALALQRFGPPAGPLPIMVAALASLAVFTLMLSQSLAGATETLYARADLDLLLSSPVGPGKVLFAKCAGLAANAFAAFALLATPLAVPAAVLADPRWLAIYLVLAAFALFATAAGLAIAIGLFRLIGPKRTRTISQLLAAIIGAAIFLVAQTRNLAGHRDAARWMETAMTAARAGGPVTWPLRALEADPAVLFGLVALAVASFAVVTAWVGRRFGSDASAAAGVAVGGVAVAGGSRRGGEGAFASGVFWVTVRKEWRLLGRDIPLLAQVFLRVLYLVPLLLLLLRNAGGHLALRPLIGVGAVVFVCGQVAGSLVWLTVAAEDAPELIDCAPASAAALRSAKLGAALAPLAALLAIPLLALLLMSPLAGAAAILGCCASALASALIGFALQKPAKRSTFRARRSGSLVASLAEFGAGAVVALAAATALMWPPLLVVPMAVAGLAAWSLWRKDRPPPYPLPKARVVVH